MTAFLKAELPLKVSVLVYLSQHQWRFCQIWNIMFKDYITILVGTLQRIHRQYIRYESALDDTLIGIENLNSGYLTHGILDPQI